MYTYSEWGMFHVLCTRGVVVSGGGSVFKLVVWGNSSCVHIVSEACSEVVYM